MQPWQELHSLCSLEDKSMAKKKTSGGLIATVINLLQTSGNVMRGLLQLALLEFDLAKRSFFLILILLAVIFGLLISCWVYAEALLVYWLVSLKLSLLLGLFIALSINLVLLLVLLALVLHYRRGLTFAATRRQLQKIRSIL